MNRAVFDNAASLGLEVISELLIEQQVAVLKRITEDLQFFAAGAGLGDCSKRRSGISI